MPGTRCPCSFRTVPAPDLRALRAAQLEYAGARDRAAAPVRLAPPLCGWCHRRPPVETAGQCRVCQDGDDR